MLPDGAGVHLFRSLFVNRFLLHVAPREPIQERCEPGAARVWHFQHDESCGVRCDEVFVIFRRLVDRAARGAARGFVDGYGAHD